MAPRGTRLTLESAIEKSVVGYARGKGWLALKFSTNGRFGSTGYPDRIFLRPGRVLFIEFKAPGKKPTPLQTKRHEELRSFGQVVYTADSAALGRSILDEVTNG